MIGIEETDVGAKEPHHADGDSQIHPTDERLQQETFAFAQWLEERLQIEERRRALRTLGIAEKDFHSVSRTKSK